MNDDAGGGVVVTDPRVELLQITYAEVLDATKHQDDKIGRMLTAIAFLTAASLALANLISGSLLVRDFDTSPESLPLAAIALGAFLVLVVITVVLLVSSLSTPLRIPGFRTPSAESQITYANGVKASQIYFMGIARVPLTDWRTKWSASEDDLNAELHPMYVEETYNLAVRTKFKYERTTEAVAFFALGLFAFGMAAMLVIFAAVSPPNKLVELDLLRRILLGLYFSVFAFIQLVTRARNYAQAIDDTVPASLRVVIAAAPVAVGLLVVPQGKCPAWAVFVAVVVLTMTVLVCLWNPGSGKPPSNWSRFTLGLVLLALLVLAGWAVARRNYAGQLAVSVAAITLTTLPSMLGPTIDRSALRAEQFDEK